MMPQVWLETILSSEKGVFVAGYIHRHIIHNALVEVFLVFLNHYLKTHYFVMLVSSDQNQH